MINIFKLTPEQKDKGCAILIGLGLVVFVWHLKLPDDYMWIFLPWIGMALLLVGVLGILKRSKDIELGDKMVWIPLLIICVSIALSGIEAYIESRIGFGEAMADVILGIFLFALYIVSRKAGERIFKIMPYAVIIESVSIVITGAFNNWSPNGGLLSWTNYDIATGLLVFGVLTSPVKKQWWISSIAIIGLFFSGSGEAILSGIILLAMVIIRRDYSIKILLPVGALVITLLVTTLTSIIYNIQSPMLGRITLAQAQAKGVIDENDGDLIIENKYLLGGNEQTNKPQTIDSNVSPLDRITGFRITHSKLTMPIKPFGYGVNLTRFYWGIPHNILLIIIEQVGILAMLAWAFLMWVLYKKTSYKYLIIGYVSLGLIDHYLFTQAATWMPVLVGVVSTSKLRNDYIFKEA